jgi:2-oxoglutarate/2-oxoacid ferredoxin oxidoreductase subunit alpha
VIAASTPGDCFFAAYDAARIAVRYMTPVILLSDGYLANGSEPWLIPDLDALPDFDVSFATEPNKNVEGEPVFMPYLRDPETLGRPWAKPGTKDLQHRIGGLEKQDETGNVSYDPENHQHMTRIRAAKVERVATEIPPTEIFGDQEGDLLVIGWGSTRGSIEAAIDRQRAKGRRVGSIHIRYINPLPPDLSQIFERFDRWIVPELNDGQLVRVLRDRYLLPFKPINKVKGMPFKAAEIEAAIEEALEKRSAA